MSKTAYFFHSDAIESEGSDLIGRRSAGQSFLRGYLEHSPGPTVHAVTQTKKASAEFDEIARRLGETRDIRVHTLRGGADFSDAGTIFFPGPGYLDAAWRREPHGAAGCSLVGMTHTMSTRRVMEGLHNLMLEPVRPWDAIICTSKAVQSVVQTQLDQEAEFIRARFEAGRVPMPQLPVIPLGIHVKDFEAVDGQRAAMRKRFGASDDAIVVLTMGRLTSVEKANPVPLFLALQQVAERTDKSIHLWMAGWVNRQDEEVLHREGAKALCPSVTTTIMDGRNEDLRRHIWSGADIFTLPADNIQETFGLVPLEAMAAGLPVVMPDWNGFRDTVLHDETGYLIPTIQQAGGLAAGALAARRFADGTDSYLHHLSILQQQTAIDVGAYSAALEALAKDPVRRRTMGRVGRVHVGQNFDWSKVIPQYLNLAAELEAMRRVQQPKRHAMPLQIDPFTLYQGYPTDQISPDWYVAPKSNLTSEGLQALDALNGRNLYQRRILPDPDLLHIASLISSPIRIADLAKTAKQRLDVTQGAVLFLAKYDFVILKRPKNA